MATSICWSRCARVRITNPLAADESVLRATMITGLVRAWGKNLERGTGDVVLAELGNVFVHPASRRGRERPRVASAFVTLSLPLESERLTVVLGRPGDDAASAVALWSTLAERLGLADVVVRTSETPARGFHPTRCAQLVDRASAPCSDQSARSTRSSSKTSSPRRRLVASVSSTSTSTRCVMRVVRLAQ